LLNATYFFEVVQSLCIGNGCDPIPKDTCMALSRMKALLGFQIESWEVAQSFTWIPT